MKATLRRLLLLAPLALPGAAAAADGLPPNQVSGTIRAINGDDLLLTTRTGAPMRVNAADAMRSRQTALLKVGGAVTAIGTLTPSGVLDAVAISRAKTAKLAWPADH